MDEQDLRHRFEIAVLLVAVGLCKKDELSEKHPHAYPYSDDFRHGLNIYAALCAQCGTPHAVVSLGSLSETRFVRDFCTKDVADWTVGWIPEARGALSSCRYWDTGPLAICEGKIVLPSNECIGLVLKAEDDALGGFQERKAYDYLMSGSQGQYVVGRRFLISNPLLSWDDRQRVLTGRYDFSAHPLDQGEARHKDADWMRELVKSSYEAVPRNARVCPSCGWTITKAREQPQCCSLGCVEHPPHFEALDSVRHDSWRLSKGIMRYIAKPGQLELAIAKGAQELGLGFELWPNKDTCDVLITLPGGAKLAVDAKDYCSARALRATIAHDQMMEGVEADEGIYVVPDATHRRHPEFVDICNQALSNKSGYSCTTLKKLLKRLKDSAKEQSHG